MKKILIANRGEIAVRVMRACRELGIPSVAVYSEADADALFARYANEAYCIGPPPASRSYLNVAKLIEVAKECGADAIHPGYGFLAENPSFADACAEVEIKFIGPSSRVLELMGSKVAARKVMLNAGVPVVPGTEEAVVDLEKARVVAREIGYPVIIKPSGGGGGIGMTIVNNEGELQKAIETSQTIAKATFGLADVYVEKYISHPRHIEIQVLGDSQGNVIHLGERECSIQRRHQKVIEEAPSPALTPRLRKEMGEAAATAARALRYEGAGTLEFLFSKGKFYFMEMNTRVQVEHPVTEMVTGVDIVKEQIRIAAGHPLGLRQKDVRMKGWAIECRINAEDVSRGFAPAPGKLKDYFAPGGIGVRVDSGVYGGYTIPPFYDSMIAKLVVWGRDRAEAIARMKRALYEYVLTGTTHNVAFHKAVLANPRFVAGKLDTHFIETETTLLQDMEEIAARETPLGDRLPKASGPKARIAAIAAVAVLAQIHQATSQKC
jgi:pyruvate carboxylase subunit A